jgi:hypothetical protein
LLQLTPPDNGGHVEDRACRRGDRDPAELADVAAIQPVHAVDADAAPAAGVPAGDGDVDIAFSAG